MHIRKAIEFLNSPEARQRPFILFLPTLLPHAPYVIPEPYYSMYDPEQLPPLKQAGSPNKPSYHELIRSYRRLDRIQDDTLKKIQAVYLGMITYVDDQFGRLMEALSANGFDDSTTVIVSSDHGDYAGDYGLVEKWPNAMEDCLTRVPLIIRKPGNEKGHVVHEPVELFDIMPTILELAGIAAAHDHFARSLAPRCPVNPEIRIGPSLPKAGTIQESLTASKAIRFAMPGLRITRKAITGPRPGSSRSIPRAYAAPR
ncbi:sulfatase-like hydrolase/transferase [Paenibacillus sp. P26]|nr:sulfatase-like hydrolase/transferase [Paenibacillus sp. P26]